MVSLNVNGKEYELDVLPNTPLLSVLRDQIGLMGTKYSCGVGECGACTVLVDGEVTRSCVASVEDAQGLPIITIEGLPEDHPVKRAWVDEQVVQCGYCQPGVIMQVAGLMSGNDNVNPKNIIESMDDVICRCGTYQRIKAGIETAARYAGKEDASS
jgi:isoquinoline 1-oxidoreductase alpha subunit